MRHALALAAVAVAAVALAPTSAVAQAERCYAGIAAYGKVRGSEEAARRAAIVAWKRAAYKKHGPAYSRWTYSGDRQVSCDWDAKATKFECLAAARPCGPVRSST